MAMTTTTQKLANRGQIVLCAASLLVIVLLGFRYRQAEEKLNRDSRRAACAASITVAEHIEATLAELRVADEIAHEIETGALIGRDALEQRLRDAMGARQGVSALSIAYLPASAPDFMERTPDAAVYFLGALRTGDSSQIEIRPWSYTTTEAQDTTKGDITKWYMRPLNAGRPVWNDEVMYSPASKQWWSGGYGVPFARTKRNGVREEGVVYADLSLDRMRRDVHTVITGDLGAYPFSASHAFLVSKSGRLLAHPDPSVVENRRTIHDLQAGLEGTQALSDLDPLKGLEDPNRSVRMTSVRDARSGRSSNVFFTRLKEADYWVAVVLDEGQVNHRGKQSGALKGHQTRLGLSLLAFLFCAACVLFRPERGDHWRLWAVTLTFTALCTLGIAALWVQYVDSDASGRDQDYLILNGAIPQKLRESQNREWAHEMVPIPTGVFVQSLEFSTANNVTVTGFVWQTHADDLPSWARLDGKNPGFTLPEAESASITKAYERELDGATVTGWYFEAVLRQEFDYSHYPFDREDVWIRMWPSRIGQGVMLTPDLASYDTLVPTDLPGIERENFVLEGWDAARSFFSYRLNEYNTTFGLPGRILDSGAQPPGDRPKAAELYFNVGLTRQFLDPFIGTLIPITVVALLLFGVLFTIRYDSASADQFGFNTSAVLGFCAALFFVVILGHTSLRERLAAQGLIYFEHFYFALYVALLFVSANSILVGRPRGKWVRFGDNLVARLCYWPLLSAAMLAVTLGAFG
jgi:hypothetical protein